MLPYDDRIMMGIAGTAVGAVGTGMSVTELQAIISIIITVLGFILSVVVPTIIKIVHKVKDAKKDGVITEEEKKEIISEVIEGTKIVAEEGQKVIETVSSKKEEESDKKSEGE